MKFKAAVVVTLKESVLDPQGVTIKEALHHMRYNQIESVRLGKFVEISLDASSAENAEKLVHETCRKLLVNQVIETYKLQALSPVSQKEA
ncbi:phosphoribosylformylglycinamidine synthase subunit PurS [bacterium]|nr:phosphoribosylformylglycinamidine synthase subunit PurS [bacterium]MCP5462554.1 phosphoribosylformylglycinamidine synthase subunit PurS [bacterium]